MVLEPCSQTDSASSSCPAFRRSSASGKKRRLFASVLRRNRSSSIFGWLPAEPSIVQKLHSCVTAERAQVREMSRADTNRPEGRSRENV